MSGFSMAEFKFSGNLFLTAFSGMGAVAKADLDCRDHFSFPSIGLVAVSGLKLAERETNRHFAETFYKNRFKMEV
jgi:hypothetical protein